MSRLIRVDESKLEADIRTLTNGIRTSLHDTTNIIGRHTNSHRRRLPENWQSHLVDRLLERLTTNYVLRASNIVTAHEDLSAHGRPASSSRANSRSAASRADSRNTANSFQAISKSISKSISSPCSQAQFVFKGVSTIDLAGRPRSNSRWPPSSFCTTSLWPLRERNQRCHSRSNRRHVAKDDSQKSLRFDRGSKRGIEPVRWWQTPAFKWFCSIGNYYMGGRWLEEPNFFLTVWAKRLFLFPLTLYYPFNTTPADMFVAMYFTPRVLRLLLTSSGLPSKCSSIALIFQVVKRNSVWEKPGGLTTPFFSLSPHISPLFFLLPRALFALK